MAILQICGRIVVESTGPRWQLSGAVKREHSMPNCLVLTRTPDLLSPNIKAAYGQLLSSVHITDWAGCTGKLINARIIGGNPFRHGSGDSRHSVTSNESEEFLIRFDKIDWPNHFGNGSPSDDWA
jgi:hypothetical protein